MQEEGPKLGACGIGLETVHVLLRCLSQVSAIVMKALDNQLVQGEAWRQENRSGSEVPVVSAWVSEFRSPAYVQVWGCDSELEVGGWR